MVDVLDDQKRPSICQEIRTVPIGTMVGVLDDQKRPPICQEIRTVPMGGYWIRREAERC